MSQLKLYIPQQSIAKVSSWIDEYDCQLKIVNARKTKLGDYKFSKGKHFISINKNLNQYSFLITLIHEIAHLMVQIRYDKKVRPHGIEWKYTFRSLLLNFIPLFPNQLQKQLSKHLINPMASTYSDYELYNELKRYDKTQTTTIEEIKDGQKFIAYNGKTFIREFKLRKRIRCKNLENNKVYLFSPLSEIKLIK
jgi:hypothetical protein